MSIKRHLLKFFNLAALEFVEFEEAFLLQ